MLTSKKLAINDNNIGSDEYTEPLRESEDVVVLASRALICRVVAI